MCNTKFEKEIFFVINIVKFVRSLFSFCFLKLMVFPENRVGKQITKSWLCKKYFEKMSKCQEFMVVGKSVRKFMPRNTMSAL